jgi:Lipocalin-like domain
MARSAGAPSAVIGTWKLVSFQFESEGSDERSDVYDEHPVGFLILTADGRAIALLTAGTRLPDMAADVLFDRMMAYSGRYRLQGDSFITAVDTAWHPAWVGTEQTRFFKVEGDTLSIKSPFQDHPKFPGRRIRGVVVWRKE